MSDEAEFLEVLNKQLKGSGYSIYDLSSQTRKIISKIFARIELLDELGEEVKISISFYA